MFGYWHSTDHDPIREGIEVWRNHFSDFRVIGDSDVEPLIARRFPRCLETYRKIRIPTCKSNLARLLALHEWGGLYVDRHCGIRDEKFVCQLMTSLDSFELIVFDRHRTSNEWHITNNFMFGRKHSEILLECATNAFRNLETHWEIEKQQGFCQYNIWQMTGTGNLADTIIDRSIQPPALKQRFAQNIWVFPEKLAPIVRFMYQSYKKPGMHWSERQKHEVLFD